MPDAVTEPEIGETVGESVDGDRDVAAAMSAVKAHFSGNPAALAIVEAWGKVSPGEAIDIAVIIGIITAILQGIQQCRANRLRQRRLVARKAHQAQYAAFQIVQRKLPDRSEEWQWSFAETLLDMGVERPELFEQLQDDSLMVCGL